MRKAVLMAAVIGAAGLGCLGQATAPSDGGGAAEVVAGEPGAAPVAPAAGANGDVGGMMDRAAAGGAQVYVDDSFASIEKLRTANRYASQGQSQLAITAYQGIIDTYGQKLVYLNNDSYMSITEYVRGKLLGMPAVEGGMYDQLLGLQAKKEIEAAVEARDLEGVTKACDRYFPSSAAFEGLSRAAEWNFERGEFSAAARMWAELATHPSAKGKVAMLLFRMGAAESLAGDHAGAKEARDRLEREFPGVMGEVDGKQVALLTQLDEVMGMNSWGVGNAEGVKDEWPAFGGGPAHARVPAVAATIGAQLWSVSLKAQGGDAGSAETGSQEVNAVRSLGANPAGVEPRLGSYPVLSGGSLFIDTGARVMALSVNAGASQWSYPEQGAASVNGVRRGRMNVPAQELMARRAAGHMSVSVSGDHVFAVLPAAGPAGIPTSDAEVEDPSGTRPTRVVCLDKKTGSEVWSTGGEAIKMEAKGNLIFIGSPVVTRQGVFVMARKLGGSVFSQMYLLKLNGETGAPVWNCYLCSASVGMNYGPVASFGSIPIPTVVDDVAYVSMGEGANCAVDGNVGRIMWLTLTQRSKKDRPMDNFSVREPQASWKFNPPLVYGDKLVAYDAGSSSGDESVGMYDRWSGKLIRTVVPKDVGEDYFDVTAGIVGSKLVLTGSKVTAIDLDKVGAGSAEAAWSCDFPSGNEAGRPEGRPFLTTKGLYVPFERGMLLVDVEHGKVGEFWQWPRTQNDVQGKPGNFLVTSEQVVVVTDGEVAGYSRWETARDNRLARIAGKPGDPEGYLALAEISFRTNHWDLSEENMKRSVELAAGVQSDSAGELLGRLYRTNLNFAEQMLGKSDVELRDRSRFYFDASRSMARTPEQQSEWRLVMSDLSLAQKKPEEAATLFNQVLTDAALRTAPFHSGDALTRAGVAAEMKFKHLIEKNGVDVYKRFEDEASGLLANGKSGGDAVILQQVVDSYPNSKAALTAAGSLADVYREKREWASEVKALRWLYPRAGSEAREKLTADLATSQMAMKRYAAALAWAERGLRQFKDASWTDSATHEQMTFAGLRDKLRGLEPMLAEGRRPTLPAPSAGAHGPAMDDESATKSFQIGPLLVPVENSPALRRNDLLFIERAGHLHIYDSKSATELTSGREVVLPEGTRAAAVIGSVGDMTVVTQSRTVMGVNTRTMAIDWQVPMTGAVAGGRGRGGFGAGAGGARVIRQANGGVIVVQGGGRVIINGNVMNGNFIAGNGADFNPRAVGGLADPEAARAWTFSRLGQPGFSTMRIFNGKLVVVANGAMSAYDVKTGKPAWVDGNGAALAVKLPAGLGGVLTGNDDLIAAEIPQIDKPGTIYYVLDADTGKFRKQVTIADERTQWRAMGDDGNLYVVTDRGVSAYDLFSDQDAPLWKRSDILPRFPGATVLTLDGLMVLNANTEVMCLSQDGGEARFGPMRLDIEVDNPAYPFVASAADGDMVIYQSVAGIAAYYTTAQANGDQVAWVGSVIQGQTPPLQGFQIADPYVVVIASGQAQGSVTTNAQLMMMDRKGGRLQFVRNMKRPEGPDSDIPAIGPWQVVDGGIAMQVNGIVDFYRAKKP